NIRNGARDRPDTDVRAALFQEPLDHDGIAAGGSLVERPCLRPRPVRQSARGRPDLPAGRDRLPHIPSHGMAPHAHRARNRLAAHATTRQLANRGDQLPLDHGYLLYRRYQTVPLELHSTLLPRGSELVSSGGQYHCRSTNAVDLPQVSTPAPPQTLVWLRVRACSRQRDHRLLGYFSYNSAHRLPSTLCSRIPS